MVVAEMLCACRCGEAWQHETRWGRIGRYFWGAVADITAAAFFVLNFFWFGRDGWKPTGYGRVVAYEPLWLTLMGPLYGTFLFASSCGTGGVFAKLCRHPVLTNLGDLGFQVYMCHYLVMNLLIDFEDAWAQGIGTEQPQKGGGLSTQGMLLAAFPLIYVISGLLNQYVDYPFRMWLKKKVDNCLPVKQVVPKDDIAAPAVERISNRTSGYLPEADIPLQGDDEDGDGSMVLVRIV